MRANKMYKDSVFVAYLTAEPRRLIEVYNAVFAADVPGDAEIEVNTLENVLYHGINNDLSFTIDGSLVVMIEDQATVNMNMPMRLLMYIARLYEKLLPSRAVYAGKTVKVPRPEFIVFYNGKDPMPDRMELRLSEAFVYAAAKEVLELTVTVYNINPGHNEEIRARSEALWNYSTFVGKIHEFERGGMALAEAIGEGVKYCIENDIMSGFLKENSSEVRNMLFTEYDPEEARKVAIEEGYEDGHEDGLRDGLARGFKDGRVEGLAEVAWRMKAEGLDLALISKVTGLREEQIKLI
jgi:predicted transposase YdaD